MMQRLLTLMAEKKASDLFISAGAPPQLKINGTTVPVSTKRLEPEEVEALLREALTDRQWSRFESENELNIGYGIRDVGSFRISVFKQRGTASAVVRFIPGDVPSFESLHLPPVLGEIVMEKRGLVLVVGATGSGKTTTLASLIDHRNTHRSGHILTLEDPIEYTVKHKRSIVNQRQIGTDAADFESALHNALRQAPDLLMIGEIRDVATMNAAISFAQSGHLVLATMHASNAAHALNRIVGFYAPENRRVLLSDLAATLRCIVAQRLVRATNGGRYPAIELLRNGTFLSELIEQGRLSDIKEAMEKNLAPGSQTFERSLVDLVQANLIAKEEALSQADSPSNLLWLLENTDIRSPAARKTVPPLSDAAPSSDRDSGTTSFSDFTLNI
jgi:twitching motility protein PilU